MFPLLLQQRQDQYAFASQVVPVIRSPRLESSIIKHKDKEPLALQEAKVGICGAYLLW